MTAVAEVAQERLVQAVEASLRNEDQVDPLLKFRAIGRGFLRWAFANPTHFQVISSRAVIEYERPSLRERNDGLRGTMHALLTQAAATGGLRPGEVSRLNRPDAS